MKKTPIPKKTTGKTSKKLPSELKINRRRECEKPDKKTKKQGVAVRFSKDFRVIPEKKKK
jgi:hypothetical protein